MSNNRNRTAGNNLERKYANELRELGYSRVVTSRAESRNLDAQKVDLFDEQIDDPEFKYFVQVKNTTRTLNYNDMFLDETRNKRLPYIIMHQKTKSTGKTFRKEGEYVIMEKDTFYNLIRKHEENKEKLL